MEGPSCPTTPIRRYRPITPIDRDTTPIAIRSEKPVAKREYLIDFVITPIVAMTLAAFYVIAQAHVLSLITPWHNIPWYVSFFLTILELVALGVAREKNKKKRRRRRTWQR